MQFSLFKSYASKYLNMTISLTIYFNSFAVTVTFFAFLSACKGVDDCCRINILYCKKPYLTFNIVLLDFNFVSYNS